MLRRTRSYFIYAASEGGSPFNKGPMSPSTSDIMSGLNKEKKELHVKNKSAKSGYVPGLDMQPGGPYARFPAYAARMMEQQEERLRMSKLIGEGKDPHHVEDPTNLSPEELSERFMERRGGKKKTQEEEDAQGPGEREDVDPRVARKLAHGFKYSNGPEKVAAWMRVFGSQQAIPHPHDSHPDFRIVHKDAPDDDHSPEAEEMRRKTGIMFFKKKTKPDEKNKDAAKNAKNETASSSSSNVNKQNQKFAETDPEYDPFTAAFTPNAEKRKEQTLKMRREFEEKMIRQEQNGGRLSPEDEKKEREKAEELKKAKMDQQQKSTGGGMGMNGYNFTRNQVGGASVTEWREKIKRIRARGEGNLVVRLQGEIGFAHVLSQTGLPEDAAECLEVGEYVWSKLNELKKASPASEGSTHQVIINVCSAMQRAARTVGKTDVGQEWSERLQESDKQMKMNMEFYNKNQMHAQNLEPEKTSGPRKHRISGNAIWAGLRNPWFNVAWARKTLGEDPEDGPRYTSGKSS